MRLATNGVTLGYDLAGSGPTVLFLHAFPLNRRMWEAQVEALRPQARTLTVDFRGFGDTDPSPGPYGLETLADDVLALVRKVRVARAVVVGLSMGGYVAFRLIAQETIPGWGYWIKQGATTLWEKWDGKDSQNHIMYGDISAWFTRVLAGINPDPAGPGFRRILLTPPPRSFFEEKLLLGLLWNRHLRDFWRRELGSAFFERLLRVVPRTWILDPAPLPPHAAIPGLEIVHWEELKELSQRERDLILKMMAG